MRRLWLGLLLCACSGSSDNEVDGSVMGISLTARDAIYFVHNGRQLFVVSDQDALCRKFSRGSFTGGIHLLEMYLWNATSSDPTTLIEGTYDVTTNGTTSFGSQPYLGVAGGCSPGTTPIWFTADSGRVILLHAGLIEPGERSQVAFRINFGNELLAGHADALYCEVPQTGTIPCVHEAGP